MIQNLNLDYAIFLTFISLLISSLLSGKYKIAPLIGLMDIPGSAEHKRHKNPVPLTGGIVLIDIVLVMVLYWFMER